MVSNHPSSLMRDSMMANLSDFNPEMGMGGHQPLTGEFLLFSNFLNNV